MRKYFLLIIICFVNTCARTQVRITTGISGGANLGFYKERQGDLLSGATNVESKFGYKFGVLTGIQFENGLGVSAGLSFFNSTLTFNTCTAIDGNSFPSNCIANNYFHKLSLSELIIPLCFSYQFSNDKSWNYTFSLNVGWRSLIGAKGTMTNIPQGDSRSGSGEVWYFNNSFFPRLTPGIDFKVSKRITSSTSLFGKVGYNHLFNHYVYGGSIEGNWFVDNRILNAGYLSLVLGVEIGDQR